MVPKVIAKGKSFKGAAQYLLHDKGRALSSERVDWTETRNLCCDDPNMAWKIMAATAKDQERLKANAGVKSTGRRSDKSVLHISLSWHPDEKDTLTRDDMLQAATEAMKAIGADDRQAIFIAHNDEAHPHLHILCNRVSPEDGRLLSSSNDRLKLSKWAESYEKDRGKILCKDRVQNNQRRQKDEYVKGKRDKSKHLLGSVNDNSRGGAVLQESQRKLDHTLAERGRKLHKKHADEWRTLTEGHKQKRHAIQFETKQAVKAIKGRVEAEFQPRWHALSHKHHAQLEAFDRREAKLFGRVKNAFDLLDKSGSPQREAENKSFGSAFNLVTSKDARRDAFRRVQEKEQWALLREEINAVKQEQRQLNSKAILKLSKLRADYRRDRSALAAGQDNELWQLTADWKQRGLERKRAFELGRAAPERAGEASKQFIEATGVEKLTDAEKKQKAIRKKAEKIKAKLKSRNSREREP